MALSEITLSKVTLSEVKPPRSAQNLERHRRNDQRIVHHNRCHNSVWSVLTSFIRRANSSSDELT